MNHSLMFFVAQMAGLGCLSTDVGSKEIINSDKYIINYDPEAVKIVF